MLSNPLKLTTYFTQITTGEPDLPGLIVLPIQLVMITSRQPHTGRPGYAGQL